MADLPQGPSIDSSFLYRQMMQGGGDGKQGPLDKPMNQGAQQLTSAHGGGGFKFVPAFTGSGRGFLMGVGDKFIAAVQGIPEQLKQVAANAGVMYSGDLPSGSMPGGNGHGLGGGGRGDIELG